ncbi:MAG: ChaN family lipoprotein [Chloracidobacterium sp.]|nr:ChaN family lipoprotein [Chloracidobacterium sp.]
MSTFLYRFLMAAVVLSSSMIVARAQMSPHMSSGYIPHRVYKSGDKRFSDFEAMLAELARADVVFVGEQHNDPATHRIERAILEGLGRRRGNVVVAMEMFERDTQRPLDDYLAGRLDEEDFLKATRPWPNYMTDYRPLIEFARVHGWKVIASNTPRRIASQVSKEGLDAARPDSESERKLVASEFSCPMDDYFKRFTEAMGNGHPTAHQQQGDDEQVDKKEQADKKKEEAEQRATLERFYYAQCVKDETMAESIANALNSKPEVQDGGQDAAQTHSLVVHFNGAFHSDYRLGAASRVVRRSPKSNVKVISVIPVENLDAINADEYRKRGDYVIFTLKPPMAQ